MSLKLLFSVVDFKMFNEDNPAEFWFDLDSTTKIKTEAKIVPLFNTMMNDHHDYWDDFVIADIKVIINLVKTTYIENKIKKEELISYEAPLEEFDSERHVYEMKVDFNLASIMDKIKRDSTYTLTISFVMDEVLDKNEDVFKAIDANTFFSTAIPFSKNGGWIHGES